MSIDNLVKELEVNNSEERIGEEQEKLLYGGLHFKEKEMEYVTIGSLPLKPTKCYSQR